MTALSALYPFILPMVRGCDTDVVDFHVRQAVIEFCKRSQSWRAELPITVIPGTATYLLPLPTDSELSMLLSFEMLDTNGNSTDEFHVLAPQRGRKLMRDNRWTSYVFLTDDALSIVVEPVPDVSDAQLVPYVSLKPTNTAATLPTFIVDQYSDAIAAGALARLFSMPKTAWTNQGEATVQRGKFLSDCGSASVRASRGNARSQTRSRGCFF